MAPHRRVLLFCVSLLVAPFLWQLGARFGGDLLGAVLALVPVAAAALYAQTGQPPSGQPRPPAGTRPA